ncbi:hypothetical protein [Mycolicibacter senuensis]|uniref:hypothetical protein n=1 Tax=Mycolicibacter senuensis TaxID=386913 RepID=UPI000DCDC9C4|nr:hypothetical protein [Mycolicibacter senuensis]RAU99916.1 hypothetical protein DQP56_10165 [Mycolicibacter senuensis]
MVGMVVPVAWMLMPAPVVPAGMVHRFWAAVAPAVRVSAVLPAVTEGSRAATLPASTGGAGGVGAEPTP